MDRGDVSLMLFVFVVMALAAGCILGDLIFTRRLAKGLCVKAGWDDTEKLDGTWYCTLEIEEGNEITQRYVPLEALSPAE